MSRTFALLRAAFTLPHTTFALPGTTFALPRITFAVPRITFALPRIAMALVLATAIFACTDGDSPTGSGGSAVGGGSDAAGLLIGQWSHTKVFEDDDGDVHSSTTVWRFEEDSSAQRMVIASSVASGITDTVTANARWEATASKLTITFQPPDTGTVIFDYEVHLSTLTLDGVQFVRDE